MQTLGTPAKNTIYKIGGGIMSQGFTQDGLKYTITLDADLVTSNVFAGYVGGDAVSVTFATSHAATMTAMAAAIAALSSVKSATVSAARVITVYPNNQINGVPVVGFAVTAGASQAGVVTAQVDNRIFPGMQVEIQSGGKLQPVTVATADLTGIGTALNKSQGNVDNDDVKEPERITIALRGPGIMVTAKASISSLVPGPVKYDGYDTVTKQPKVSSTSVTVTNQMGWAIDAGTNVGDEIRVILK